MLNFRSDFPVTAVIIAGISLEQAEEIAKHQGIPYVWASYGYYAKVFTSPRAGRTGEFTLPDTLIEVVLDVSGVDPSRGDGEPLAGALLDEVIQAACKFPPRTRVIAHDNYLGYWVIVTHEDGAVSKNYVDLAKRIPRANS